MKIRSFIQPINNPNDEEMVCPLLSIGKDAEVSCITERCAFWVYNYNKTDDDFLKDGHCGLVHPGHEKEYEDEF